VTNVASNAEESHLREFFSTAGEIERIRVSAPKANATRKAYIEFTASEAVSAAVLLNGCLLLNHPLNIVECAYPVAEDANFEDRVELNALETGSDGLARLGWSNEVSEQDVNEALRLMEMSKMSLSTGDMDRREDQITALYRILLDTAVTSGQFSVSYVDAVKIATTKGYSKQALDQCLQDFSALDVWILDEQQNLIFVDTFVESEEDEITALYRILRDTAVTSGQFSVSYVDAVKIATTKGHSKQALDQCLQEFSALDVWILDEQQNLTFVE